MNKQLNRLVEEEKALFYRDYERYFREGETKPGSVGEPFILKNPDSETGVILVHGLMAAPEEVREWAEFLYSKGYTVYAPRLKGHGTSAKDLSIRKYQDWLESIDRGTEILRCCCRRFVIAGFSTGAGLALMKAVQDQETFAGVISVSAPFKFRAFSARFTEILQIWNRITLGLKLKGLPKSFVTNHPDNPQINYHICPVNGIAEVRRLMRCVSRALPGLKIPALIVQGSRDPKVDPQSGRRIFEKLGSSDAVYREIDYHLHGIVRGSPAGEVFTASEEFLNRIL